MSVVVVGGDEITAIKAVLYNLGAEKIYHFDGRKRSDVLRRLPVDTQCVVMITDFLNHNAMKVFRKQAKERDIPLICSKRSVSCIYAEYCRAFQLYDKMGIDMNVALCDSCPSQR